MECNGLLTGDYLRKKGFKEVKVGGKTVYFEKEENIGQVGVRTLCSFGILTCIVMYISAENRSIRTAFQSETVTIGDFRKVRSDMMRHFKAG